MSMRTLEDGGLLYVRSVAPDDIKNGLVESLDSLARVGLNEKVIREILEARCRNGVTTLVAVTFHVRDILPDGAGGLIIPASRQRVVGTVSFFVDHKLIHEGGKAGFIEDVAVCKEYQGKRVGTALVETALERLQLTGCYKAVLTCSSENRPFYQKLGFHAPADTHHMRIDLR